MVFAVAACARTGDFGRPARHPAEPAFYQEIGTRLSDVFSGQRQRFALSEDERELRARAWRFIERDDNVPFPENLLVRLRAGSDRTEEERAQDIKLYYAGLVRSRARTGPSFWSRLIVDMRSDQETIGPFAETAFRVVDMDRQRRRKLVGATRVSDADREIVEQRMAENRETIEHVRRAIVDRIESYGYALEKGGIDFPDLHETEARKALGLLKERASLVGEVLTLYDGSASWAAEVPSERGNSAITVIPAPALVGGAAR